MYLKSTQENNSGSSWIFPCCLLTMIQILFHTLPDQMPSHVVCMTLSQHKLFYSVHSIPIPVELSTGWRRLVSTHTMTMRLLQLSMMHVQNKTLSQKINRQQFYFCILYTAQIKHKVMQITSTNLIFMLQKGKYRSRQIPP